MRAPTGRKLWFGLLAFALCACDRGCLTRWIRTESGASTPEGRGEAPTDLAGTDCSDGLLRCRDGMVEVSVRAVLPPTCAGKRPEAACACPWETVTRCPSGCALEGVEVVPSRAFDAGNRMQLCRPDAPVARPILPSDPQPSDICTEEGLRCVDSVVRRCERAGVPSRAYAYCVNGCEGSIGIDVDPTPTWTNQTADGVVAILCRRDHAERR